MRTWLIRAAGSAVVLVLLFWFLPREAIWQAFARVSPMLFLAVLGAFLVAHVVAAAKWWLLLERGVPFAVALRAHFAGLAANLCLPGAVGGDAVRAGFVHKALGDGPRLTAGAVADRLVDMVALAFLSLAGVLALRGDGAGAGLAVEAGAVLVLVLLSIVYLMPWAIRRVYGAGSRLPARHLALRLAGAFVGLGRRPGLLLVTLTMSVAIQGVLVLLQIQLAEATGVALPIAAWFFAWPLAKIVAILPVSLGGLGVREGVLAALLVPFGGAAAQIVAAGLIWQAVLFSGGAIGALVVSLSGARLRLLRTGESE